MKKISYGVQSLSILPVLVSFIIGYSFAVLQYESPNYLSLITLALTVHLIYLVDGLLDVTFFDKELLSTRHQFIKEHFFNISIYALALTLVLLILIFFLPLRTLYFGIFLAILVLIYLFLICKFPKVRPSKEFLMPPLFCLGILAASAINFSSINASTYVLIFMLLLLVVQNALIISGYEHRENASSTNIYRLLKPKNAGYLINMAAIFNLFTYVLLFSNGIAYKNMLALNLLLISLVASYFYAKNSFASSYRLLFDALFCTPVVLFLFF
jgi:hypothetical protein